MSNPLPGVLQTAAPDLTGFDTDAPITSAGVAQQFKAGGYSFCIRYLSLTTSQGSGDLSNKEAGYILNGGLALSAVQHPTSLTLTEALGTTHGANAASNAASVGLPPGMILWCDLEEVKGNIPQNTQSATIAYCHAWYAAVAAAGYIPGIYVGYGTGLTGTQIYDLPFAHYWKSCSNVPTPDSRSYQMKQTCYLSPEPPLIVNGYSIDKNITSNDNDGGAVIWLAPAVA